MKKPSFLTAGIGFQGAGLFRVRGAAAREAARLADLAVQHEELLDQVWRCQREWKLDDRIAYACRTRRRGRAPDDPRLDPGTAAGAAREAPAAAPRDGGQGGDGPGVATGR